MAIVTTDNKYYSDIADAIRNKNESSTQYKPEEMAEAINAIEVGEGVLLDNGYLYNGIILSELPDWDKDEYPYASITFIREGNEWAADLILLSKNPTYDSSSDEVTYKSPGLIYHCYSSIGYAENYGGTGSADNAGILNSWGLQHELYDHSNSILHWTNTTIRDTNGFVYLAASEPVKVNYGEGYDISEGSSEIVETVSIDFSQYEDGIFTETLDTGETITYDLTFDSNGRPTRITSDSGVSVTVEW